MMNERLLQFIWQFQYFNKTQLVSTTGEQLVIVDAGRLNTNQGPDFLEARIKVDRTIWAGTVELHVLSSDWRKHRHQQDQNYKNVILHVVWQEDESPGSAPVLELKSRVPKVLLRRYQEWMESNSFIPCEKTVSTVHRLVWQAWKERLLAERLLRKTKTIGQYLQENKQHWEETFWWLLARNFGIRVNADAFESIARSLPVRILSRHRNQIHQLEALLLGQGGFLKGKFKEEYPGLLQKEYRARQRAYQLKPVDLPVHFLRMRPGNFPTVRLAQLAMLVHLSVHLFSGIKEAGSLEILRKFFDVTASDYWHYHYRFDEPGVFRKKKPGTAMIDNIIINTVVPVLFAYGDYHDDQQYRERALLWLEQTGPENNSITREFRKLGIISKSAFDTQAMLELKNEYCDRRRCLECAVGNAILKKQINSSR